MANHLKRGMACLICRYVDSPVFFCLSLTPFTLQTGKDCKRCSGLSNRCILTLSQKCDGVRPTCGSCRGYTDDCHYEGDQKHSKIMELEETVSRLESRIHELEHPDQITPSVLLHHPYSIENTAQQPSVSSSFVKVRSL